MQPVRRQAGSGLVNPGFATCRHVRFLPFASVSSMNSHRAQLHSRVANVGCGKVALVVGASRGMGRQIALDLASVGGYAGGFLLALYPVTKQRRAYTNAVAVAAKTRSNDLDAVNLKADANSSEVD